MQPRRPQQKKSVPQRGSSSARSAPANNSNPNSAQLSHRVSAGGGVGGLPLTSPKRSNSNSREAMVSGATSPGGRQSVGGASRTSMGVLMGNTRHRRSRSAGADGQRGVVRRADLFLNEHQQRTDISNRFEADREVLLGLFVKGSAKAKDTAILRLDNTVSDLTKEMELNLFNNQRDLANIGRCLGSLYEDCLAMGLATIDSFSRCVSDEEPAVYANRIAQLKLSNKKPSTVSSQHFVMPPPSPTSEARILYSNALAALSSPITSTVAPLLPVDVQHHQQRGGSTRMTSPPAPYSGSSMSPQYNQGDIPSRMPQSISAASLSTSTAVVGASGSGFRFPSSHQQRHQHQQANSASSASGGGVEVALMSASSTLPHGSHASQTIQTRSSPEQQQQQSSSLQNRGGGSMSLSPALAGGKKYSVTFSATSGATQPSMTDFVTTPGASSLKSELLDGGGVRRTASISSTDVGGAAGDTSAFASSLEKCPTCHQLWDGTTNNKIDNQTLPPTSARSIRPAAATPDDTNTDTQFPITGTSSPREEDPDTLSAMLVDLMERCGVSGSYVDFSAAPHAEVTAYNIEGFVKDLSNSLQHLLHVVAGKLRYSDTRMAHLERVLDDKQTQLIATERMLHSYLIRAPSDLNRSIDMVRALGEEVQERLFTMENKLLATMEDLLTGNTAMLLYEDKGPNVDPKAITGGGPGDTSHKRSTAVHTASSTVVVPKVSLPGIDTSLGGAGAGTRGTALAATRLRIPEDEENNVAAASSSQKNNTMMHLLGLNTADVDSNGKTREERLEAHKASLVSHFKAQVAGIRSSQADLLQDLRDEILSLQRTRISTDITRGVSSPHTDESIKFCLTEPNAVQDSYRFLLTRHGQFVPNPGSNSVGGASPLSTGGTDATTSPAAYFHGGRHIGSLESTSRHERAVQDEAYAKAQACFAQGGTSHPLLRTNIPIHYRKRLEEDTNLYDRTQLLRLLDLVSHEPRVSEAITCVMAEYEAWEAANPGEVAKRIATSGGSVGPSITTNSQVSNNKPIAVVEPRSIAAQQKRQARREAGMQLEGKQRSLETVGLAAPPSLLERILSTGTNLQEETKEEQYAEQYDRYLLTINGGGGNNNGNGSTGRSSTGPDVHQPLMIGNAKVSLASRKEIMAAFDDNEAAQIATRQAEELERSRQHHESRLTFQREVNSRSLDPLVPTENISAFFSGSSINHNSGGGTSANSASLKKYPARNSEYTEHYVLDNMYSKAHQLPSKTQVKTQQINTIKRNDLGLQKLLEEIPQNPILDPVFSSSSDGGGGGMIDVASSRHPLLLATPAARQWHTASVIHGDNMRALEDAVRRSGNSNTDSQLIIEQNEENETTRLIASSSSGGGGSLVTTTRNNGEKAAALPVDFNTLPSLNGTKPFHSRRRLSGPNSLTLGAAMPDLPSLPGSSGISSDALAFRKPDGTKFTDSEIIRRHLSGEKPPPRCAMPVSTAMKIILQNGGDVSASGGTSPSSARRPGCSRATANATTTPPPQNERYNKYIAQLGGSPVVVATTDPNGNQPPPRPTTADASPALNTIQERRPLYSGYAGDQGSYHQQQQQHQRPSRLTYPPTSTPLDSAGNAYTSVWESADPSAAYALPSQETTIATKRLLERQRQLISELKP